MRRFSARFRLDGTILLHDALTIAAALLVAGHLYLALVNPPSRPALRGILLGTVDAEWARAHHAKWAPATPAATPLATGLRRPFGWLLVLGAATVAILTLTFASAHG